MAVAKRQRREKPMKIEQRKVRGPEWEIQVKQTALLAGPSYIGQTQGKEKKYKRRSQNWAGGFSSFWVFWVGLPSYLEEVFSLACQIKQGALTLVHQSLQIFAVARQNQGNYKFPKQIYVKKKTNKKKTSNNVVNDSITIESQPCILHLFRLSVPD